MTLSRRLVAALLMLTLLRPIQAWPASKLEIDAAWERR